MHSSANDLREKRAKRSDGNSIISDSARVRKSHFVCSQKIHQSGKAGLYANSPSRIFMCATKGLARRRCGRADGRRLRSRGSWRQPGSANVQVLWKGRPEMRTGIGRLAVTGGKRCISTPYVAGETQQRQRAGEARKQGRCSHRWPVSALTGNPATPSFHLLERHLLERKASTGVVAAAGKRHVRRVEDLHEGRPRHRTHRHREAKFGRTV